MSALFSSQVSHEVGKPAQQCAALYKQHALYLNLASQLIQKEAFMGMVRSSQEHNPQVRTPSLSAACLLALHQKKTSTATYRNILLNHHKALYNLQSQLQQANSASLGSGLRQHGSRSTSAAVHSPRQDSLHSTPRHHLKPREPASMPKVCYYLVITVFLFSQSNS